MISFEPVEPPRDRWGRPLIKQPDGKKVAYTRATTLAATLDNRRNLEQWMKRNVAIGIGTREDLYLQAAGIAKTPDAVTVEKTKLNQLVEEAETAAASNKRANLGTAIHAFTCAWDRGDQPAIPDGISEACNTWVEITKTFKFDAIEQFVVCDELQAAGTADRIGTIPGHNGLFIMDLKTGSNIREYSGAAIAQQLAIYAHSCLYDPVSGARTTIPELRQDVGVVIHIDAATGESELLWVDIRKGWEAAKISAWVRAYQQQAKKLFTTLTNDDLNSDPVTSDIESKVIAAINAAGSRDELANIWAAGTAAGQWRDEWTVIAQKRLQQIEAA